MHEHSDARDPQAEDGVVHPELPPRHGRHEVRAVLPAAAEQNLQEGRKIFCTSLKLTIVKNVE